MEICKISKKCGARVYAGGREMPADTKKPDDEKMKSGKYIKGRNG